MQRTAATHYDPINKIWSGPKRKDVYGADMTMGEVILHNLGKMPRKVIQVMDTTGEELTAAQLIRDSKLIAVAIQNFGLKIGDVVGIVATNTTNLTAVLVGAFLCGAPVHATHPYFDKQTIKFIYEVSQPKLIFCDVETYEMSKAVMDELELKPQFVTVNGKINGVKSVSELLVSVNVDVDALIFPCKNMTGDDTGIILCSSGSTGTPKAVLCSHRTMINRPLFINLVDTDVVFTFSTMYWTSAYLILYSSLMNGVKRVITNKPFTPEYFVELIEKYKITHMINTPNQWAAVLKKPNLDLRKRLSSLSTVICGGSKVPKLVSEPLNAILENSMNGVIVGYGMSEVSGISRNEAHSRREGTEGKLGTNIEVCIVGSDGGFLGPNEEGIVYVRVPYKWPGYYRNPEATQAAYVDGWVISGDIGYFDDDGFLHICTRNNDVFKSNNFQIYPELIEEVVMQLQGIQEICVFGVPDFVLTNLPACAIVREDSHEGVNLSAEHIIKHVEQNMASAYHIKGGVYFLPELPKTGSGKILRRKMVEFLNLQQKNSS